MSSTTWTDLLSRSREAWHQLLLIDKSTDGKHLHMYAQLGNPVVATKWPWKWNYRQTFLFRYPNGKRKFSVILIFFLLPPMEMVPFVLLTRHRKWGREGRGGEREAEMVLAKESFFPGAEIMWTAAGRRVVFRPWWWIPEVTGERTEESSGIRKDEQMVDRLNRVTQERIKVKAKKGINFQGQIDSLPTLASPSPSLQTAEKDFVFYLAGN